MYTRFYDNTIETKFIKLLVATTNIPLVSVWREGEFAIRGMFYIHEDSIWRCNHTGFPKSIIDECEVRSDLVRYTQVDNTSSVVKKNNYTSILHISTGYVKYFTRIKPYVFGEEYYGITGKYTSKTLGYDPTTHFYLGQYLRMLRDIYKLDLMTYYNCYCGETLSDVDFDSSGATVVKRDNTSIYKIMSVPVRFGKTYMIALDSDIPVETMCVIYSEKGLMKDMTDNLNDVEDTDNLPNTYHKFQRLSFNRPNTIRIKSWHQLYNKFLFGEYGELISYSNSSDNDVYLIINTKSYDQALGQYEKYLRLLIKVPKTNTSSLVVIEGDYSVGQSQEMVNTNNVTFTNMSGIDTTVNSRVVTGEAIRPIYISSKYNNKNVSSETVYEGEYNTHIPLVSPLGLLQISDGNNYAFSNRLIEYLLLNVINHLEQFDDNIKRIQTYAKSQINKAKNLSIYTGAITPGVWDEDLRKYLFDLCLNSVSVKLTVDLSGYVDKDTESIITRGLEV